MITQEHLREVLAYDPDTGIFTWKIQTQRTQTQIGDVAGAAADRYVRIRVDGQLYKAHQLAWLYVHGVWPQGDLDHKDQDKSNNRIANLRLATRTQNCQNQINAQKNNRSGYRGVDYYRTRWRAQICVNGHRKHLGHFDTPEQAHEAYLAAKRELHPFWTPKECITSPIS